MIAFPAAAAIVSAVCMIVIGSDAIRRPRPDRNAWSLAFLVFAVAAASEVAGSMFGWSPMLARVYYLSGAVLVVGILALGELYLLLGTRMPSITPGVALLVTAVSATVVWSAPINAALLETAGWTAIERGPPLVALAASINAAGTAVLVGGALYSAWRMRGSPELRRRSAGCVLIALGTIVVATGGTLTRFGHRDYLYLAMTVGISIIFLGVMLTRSPGARATTASGTHSREIGAPAQSRLTALPTRKAASGTITSRNEGAAFVSDMLLPLGEAELARTCIAWGATPLGDEPLSRELASRVWALRLVLGGDDRTRFDRLPMSMQAQLGELYAEVWSNVPTEARSELHA